MTAALPLNKRETDDALMQRVQRNDTEAFAEIYARYASQALAVAMSVSHNRGLAEDAVQEGFVSIWRGRATYNPRPGSSCRAWAMRTVRNRAVDGVRMSASAARPQTSSLEHEVIDSTAATPHENVAQRETHGELEEVLDRLPEAQAAVISLAYFGELSHTEIAAELDLPPGTVKGRMRLGLEKMRHDLDVA